MICRDCFSSSASDDDVEPAIAPADVGWYSEASLNSRLAKRRKRGSDGRGRTRPPRSEEDYYMEAGVPGYDVDRSTMAAAERRGIKFGHLKYNEPNGKSGSVAADLATGRSGSGGGPAAAASGYTRVSTVELPSGEAARRVEEAYEKHALPAYSSAEGFQGAELLVGDG